MYYILFNTLIKKDINMENIKGREKLKKMFENAELPGNMKFGIFHKDDFLSKHAIFIGTEKETAQKWYQANYGGPVTDYFIANMENIEEEYEVESTVSLLPHFTNYSKNGDKE